MKWKIGHREGEGEAEVDVADDDEKWGRGQSWIWGRDKKIIVFNYIFIICFFM